MDPTDSEHVIYLFIAKSFIFCEINFSELLRKYGGKFFRDFHAFVYVPYVRFLFHGKSKNAFLFPTDLYVNT
jgi:hypothetical protein